MVRSVRHNLSAQPALDLFPGADRHRGWFPADAERHRRDAPRYCPACAAALVAGRRRPGAGHGVLDGTDRVFACFCGACGWSGDIVLADRVIGHEAAG